MTPTWLHLQKSSSSCLLCFQCAGLSPPPLPHFPSDVFFLCLRFLAVSCEVWTFNIAFRVTRNWFIRIKVVYCWARWHWPLVSCTWEVEAENLPAWGISSKKSFSSTFFRGEMGLKVKRGPAVPLLQCKVLREAVAPDVWILVKPIEVSFVLEEVKGFVLSPSTSGGRHYLNTAPGLLLNHSYFSQLRMVYQTDRGVVFFHVAPPHDSQGQWSRGTWLACVS